MKTKKLLNLTPEQEKIAQTTKKEWLKFIFNSGDEIDIEELNKWGNWLYSVHKYKLPEQGIFIGDSPEKCQQIANLINNTTNKKYIYSPEALGQSGAWVTYINMYTNITGYKNDKFNNFVKFLKSGVFLSIFFDKALIVCRRPIQTLLNDKKEFHCTDGPAILWRDGSGLYFSNGVPMKKNYILTPASYLDPICIATERNAEVRRELVRKIGIDRFISKYGNNVLDACTLNNDLEYKLVTLTIENMNITPTYLIMKNPSTGVFYAEGVPPDCTTVLKALAWRDEENSNYILPDILT
jgi:hypothetical protein